MKAVIVTRNGEIKLRIVAQIINGVLYAGNGKNILVNNDLIQAPHTKESIVAAIKAGKITSEIEAMGMRIGDNGNGLVIYWADEYAAKERAAQQATYNALPASVRAAREEREAIDRLYAAANQSLNHDTDESNVMRGYQQQAEADRRLKVWKETYPTAAVDERREELIRKAEKQEELARDAMLYDADGWLDTAAQERSRDEYLAKAAALRAEALKL